MSKSEERLWKVPISFCFTSENPCVYLLRDVVEQPYEKLREFLKNNDSHRIFVSYFFLIFLCHIEILTWLLTVWLWKSKKC